MLAIVLSGGGARGAYQMGVWKALRKLNVKYEIVTGTSIGALNGMMMTQNQYYKCLNFWKKVNFDVLFENFNQGECDKDIYWEYISNAVNGGLKITKLETLIDGFYRPQKMYSTKIKYGVVSYNMDTKTPHFASNISTPPSKLKDYILASAAVFPFFEPKKILNENYIDGGYYDNMPIDYAVKLGATKVIAVNLDTSGIFKKSKADGVEVIYIKPKTKLEPFLMFESNSIRKMMRLGYNDAMKALNKSEGEFYTFKKRTIENLIRKYLWKYSKNYEIYLDIKEDIKILEKKLPEIIEKAAKYFELDITKMYTLSSINKDLSYALKNTENVNIKDYNAKNLKKMFKKTIIIKNLYNKLQNHEKIPKTYLLFLKNEIMIAIYLYTIKMY